MGSQSLIQINALIKMLIYRVKAAIRARRNFIKTLEWLLACDLTRLHGTSREPWSKFSLNFLNILRREQWIRLGYQHYLSYI